ncbi:MAG: hypothetical protein EP343_08035 [Deltaproteobacteria bacterium]|nr:MAG: hypothetical protein EP343_08035 [Deltaproteobacteria bacterium]
MKCSNDIDCAALVDHVCALTSSGELLCQPKQNNAKKLREVCDPAATTSECESRTCHPKRKICTSHCAKDEDCPSGVCESVEFEPGKIFAICLGSLNQCNRDKDCGTGNNNDNLCALQQTSPTELATRCRTAVGQRPAGQSCLGDGDCIHNNCYNREYCASFCLDASDCPTGMECKEQEILLGANKYKFKTCQHPAEGLPCKTDKQCLRQGYICAPIKVGTKLELRCINNTQAPYLDSCSKNEDCKSGVCLLTSGEQCSKPCENDNDCAQGSATVKCLDVLLDVNGIKDTFKMCVPQLQSCAKTSDCTNVGDVCAPHVDASGQFSLRCLPNNSSAKLIGADCASSDECASRICYNKVCASLCMAANDCGGGKQGFGCTQESIKSPNPKVPDISAMLCSVPSAGLKCTTHLANQSGDSCPSATNDTCRIVDVNGTPEQRCRTAAGTAEVGASCSKNADCKSGTCLTPDGICTAPCRNDNDCASAGADLKCVKKTLQGKEFSVCAYQGCSGDPDCDAGKICANVISQVGRLLACVQPNKQKKAGEACSKNGDCQSNICHPKSSICVPPCAGGKDISCPPQYACELATNGPDSINLCLPIPNACQSNGTCTSGQVCVYTVNSTSGKPRQTCGAALGDRKLGDFCDPTATSPQCITGFCNPSTKRCGQFCESASDCPADTHRCTSVTVAITQPGSTQSNPMTKNFSLRVCQSLLCRYNGDCQTGEVCAVSLVNSAAVKKCEAIGVNKKLPGQTCTLDADCATGLCRNNVCVALCSAHRHCADNEQCGPATYITTTTNACLKGTRASCSGDKDCATGEVCQVNSSGGKPAASCQKFPTGGIPAGGTCNPNDGFPGKCASHMCDAVTKKCLQACAPGLNDCGTGEVCDSFSILGGTINACIPPPQSCTKGSDCSSGTVCAVSVSQGSVAYSCLRPPSTRTKKVGDACNPNAAFPGECQTSLCHPELRVCVNTCQQDSDCTDTTRPLCGKMAISGGLLARACVSKNVACDQDANCPSSEPVCGVELSNNTLSTKCSRGSTFGSKKIGDTCDPSQTISKSECLNRFCEAGRSVCTAVCQNNDQCPTGLVCAQTRVEGNRTILGCVPAAGSTCTKLQACAVPNVCRVIRETSGVVAKCQTVGGKGVELTCSGSSNITTECSSGICHPTNDRCTSVCQQDDDCLLGKCKAITLEGFQVKVCDSSCAKDSDCPTGQICGLSGPGNKLVLSCIKPDSQKAAAGATCDPTKRINGNDCQSSFCSMSNSKCTTSCTQNSDCGSGQICTTGAVRLPNGTLVNLKGCFPTSGSCLLQNQCATGTLCQLEAQSSSVGTICKAADSNRLPEGNTCSSTTLPGDCQTGLCDPQSKQCTGFCTKDSDCNGTRSKCGSITANSASFKACVKP